MLFLLSGGLGVGSGSGLLVGAGEPELGQGLAGGEVVGGELQEVFGAGFGPVFLAAFDAAVDEFDGRFHAGGGDG